MHHQWEAGGIAVWDNRSTQHYALADYWPHDRVNQRATLRRIITSVLSGDVFHDSSGATQPHWASFLVKQYPAELPTFA